MWGYMEHSGWTWGMGFGMLLLWGLFAVAIISLLRTTWNGEPPAHRGRQKDALEILKERYARGEIGHDEFEQKKHDLEN